MDKSDYARKIRALAEQFRDWVVLEGWTFGDRKRDLLAGHRFGINACQSEAFGVAVAEMVLAGCVVFVPNGGGQVEIANDPALIFSSEDDAVEKITAVLASDAEEERLRAHLQRTAKAFSVENFMESMRKVVREFLGNS